MSKFKIGDKVRYLGPTDDPYINPGAIGTIIKLNKKEELDHLFNKDDYNEHIIFRF